MKKNCLFIVLFLVLKLNIFAQLNCPSTIYICNGLNEITFEDIGKFNKFSIRVTQNSGPISFSFNLISIVNNTVKFSSTLNLIEPQDYTLTYTFSDANENSCWGTAILADDQIFLDYKSNCQNESIGNFPSSNCPTPSDKQSLSVCQEDTTTFYPYDIDNKALNINGNEFVTSLGTMVSTTLGEFKMHWTNEGSDCVHVNRENQICEPQYYYVTVVPKKKLKIENKNLSNQICINEVLELRSKELGKFKWTVSDGRSSFDNIFRMQFSSSGIYTIVLSDEDPCNCFIPDTLQIEVKEGKRPSLFCHGTVCEGSEITYFSDQICSPFLWNVSSNGAILEGGKSSDSFIKIKWQEAEDGVITLSTPGCIENTCVSVTDFTIPIIPKNLKIHGDSIICAGGESRFTIKEYEGSKTRWKIKKYKYSYGWSIFPNSFNLYSYNPEGKI
ncbi:MAG: Microbial collagenase precursor, partial [Bacteroidota bacterium]